MLIYSELLKSSKEPALVEANDEDRAFVIATIVASATSLAKDRKLEKLDANLFFEALGKFKLPPFDPFDPCPKAAVEILKKRRRLSPVLMANAENILAEATR